MAEASYWTKRRRVKMRVSAHLEHIQNAISNKKFDDIRTEHQPSIPYGHSSETQALSNMHNEVAGTSDRL